MTVGENILATRTHTHLANNAIEIEIDGEKISAFRGESVAAVLMVSGTRIFTKPSRYNLSRTMYCGMGICHQCLVSVDGVRDVRACMTEIYPGIRIETQLPTERALE